MKNLFIRLVALLGAAMAVHGVSAQEPQKHEAELRFDQAQPSDQEIWKSCGNPCHR